MSTIDQAHTRNGASSTSSSQPPSDQSLKLAVAISLLRSKLLHKQPPEPSSDSDSLRWKRKAKERKQEILGLREELKQAEDASLCDVFPRTAICKCYFFDNLGELSANTAPPGGSDHKFNDVLRRRFLRQVRFKERRRKGSGSNSRRLFLDLGAKDEAEHLSASVDFLVELCDTASPDEEANFANWSHQAVDFILASLKDLLSMGKSVELVEGIVSSLITRLVRRMCSPSHEDSLQHINDDAQFCAQHLIRKLGSIPYIGQRAILAVSQRICIVAEHMLGLDPFDDGFVKMHDCLYIMIQLIEFLISDYLLIWSGNEDFESGKENNMRLSTAAMFEQWVTSVLHARKALELLESRNGLYVLYMDRVVGGLAKLVSQVCSLQKINQDVLDNLFR